LPGFFANDQDFFGVGNAISHRTRRLGAFESITLIGGIDMAVQIFTAVLHKVRNGEKESILSKK